MVWLLVPLAVSVITAGARQLGSSSPQRPAPRELVRRALVVLPSDKDQRALLRAVSRALETDPRVDVLVVESSGTSAGVDQISQRVSVLHEPSLDSDTAALQVGAARGLSDGYDAVIELSLTHSRLARRITSLLEALDDGAHVAVGSRYVPGGRVIGCPFGRRMVSRSANVTLRWLTGVPVSDLTAHIRAYRRSAVEQALLHANGTARALGVDVMLRCRHAGLRVTEIPVTAAGPMCTAVTVAGGRELLVRALRARHDRAQPRSTATIIERVDAATVATGR